MTFSKLARRHVEQDTDTRGHAFEIPNMRDRRSQLDMPHALTPHFSARDLNSATIADHALKANALILAAMALPIFGRTKDLFTEETIALRLERTDS